jgi:hypothetical protein
MKLSQLFETKIENEHGRIHFAWKKKSELEDEEHEGYLPEGINKILELEVIQATAIGQGHGKILMKQFLDSAQAKSADAIYLDLNPYTPPTSGKSPKLGSFDTDEVLRKLEKFYKQFGFRNNAPLRRMWIFKKPIPDSELPS